MDDQPIIRVFNAVPIKADDFTITEALQSTQGNKATGLDSIPAEALKLKCVNDQLLEMCSIAYYGDMPDMWLKGNILP